MDFDIHEDPGASPLPLPRDDSIWQFWAEVIGMWGSL